jgi:hypothetical protein
MINVKFMLQFHGGLQYGKCWSRRLDNVNTHNLPELEGNPDCEIVVEVARYLLLRSNGTRPTRELRNDRFSTEA